MVANGFCPIGVKESSLLLLLTTGGEFTGFGRLITSQKMKRTGLLVRSLTDLALPNVYR
jgi:hypothetical protein